MAKLRLSIKSTDVLGVYGIVDIVFNGATLASAKQLSATIESLEYNADILTSSNNVLKINLLNPQAHDANNDGMYNGAEDQTLKAQMTALSYAIDNVNFTTLLPQTATTYNISSGLYAGNVITMTENISQFSSCGNTQEILFNSDGIVDNSHISGVKWKLLENGNIQEVSTGKTYDPDGNEVSAP